METQSFVGWEFGIVSVSLYEFCSSERFNSSTPVVFLCAVLIDTIYLPVHQ